MTIRALVNPIAMIASVGNVLDVEATLREIARNIELEISGLGFIVYVQYSYRISGYSWDGGSAGTGGNSSSSGGSSSSSSSSSKIESNVLPDTCRNIDDVKEFLVRLLHENNVIINPEKIVGASCGCATTARKYNGIIEICNLFYQWPLKDQYSILWHEIYHLRNDISVVGNTQLLSQPVQLVPDSEMLKIFHAITLDEIKGLFVLPQIKMLLIQDRKDKDLTVRYIEPPEYYKNEINAYKTEMETNTDVTESYQRIRKYQLWLNQERYKISQKYYK